MEIVNWTCKKIVDSIKIKDVSCVEVAEAFLKQIENKNKEINAVIKINPRAMELAKALDHSNSEGGLLKGLPIGIKDLFCTKGLETTAASKILDGFVPPYTATCVSLLEAQGAYSLAKLNMDEFAMGSSNETSPYGVCKNPWDLAKVPGGSSGGSAAAVAAKMVPAALGSDTGGSIRQPAHFCGLSGIKPTYGSVSRYGMVAFASSLDQAGPMARTLEDCALILDSMMGADPKDPTTVNRKALGYGQSLADVAPKNLKGIKVGLPKEYFTDELADDIAKYIDQATSHIKAEGGELVEISLPHTQYAVPVYYLIATSEASSNLSRYDGVRFGKRGDSSQPVDSLFEMYEATRTTGFGDEVKRRILLGTFSLSSGSQDAYYKKACQVRRLIQEDFLKSFKNVDIILTPVSVNSAFKIGEKISDPVSMYYNDIFTTPTSLSGLPGLSLPMGLDSQKMPVGLQLIGRPYDEKAMLQFGLSLEQYFNFQEVYDERSL